MSEATPTTITQVQDLKERWVLPDSIPVPDKVLERLIEDAEDSVETAVPGVLARVESGTVPARRIKKIVARAIFRVLRNPEGLRSIQTGTGPMTGSTTFGGDEPGEIYISDTDIRELKGARAKGQAFTVSTTRWPR